MPYFRTTFTSVAGIFNATNRAAVESTFRLRILIRAPSVRAPSARVPTPRVPSARVPRLRVPSARVLAARVPTLRVPAVRAVVTLTVAAAFVMWRPSAGGS